MRGSFDLPVTCVLTMACAILIGCGGERTPLPGAGNDAQDTRLPPGPTPAVERGLPASQTAPTQDDGDPPLKVSGIGSREEMDAALTRMSTDGPRRSFERGFRDCFTSDRSRRNYANAKQAMEAVLAASPDFPPAYRVLAYATFNLGFDMVGATRWYEKAVEMDPEYGEAHYALSFMLTQFDKERGRTHFERAMELGVPDERNLAEQFYPE